MRKLILTLALVCLSAVPEVFAQATSPASDDVVIVGNPAQPFMPNHRATIQEAIRKAGAFGVVIVPPGYPGAEDLTTLSNPNSVLIIDLRGGTFKTLPALAGGGGGSGCIGGANTYLQFNDNGNCGGNSALRFDKSTSTFYLPDGTSWGPGGIFPANPSSNTIINFDSSAAQAHHVNFRSTVDGQLCLAGAGAGFNTLCVSGDSNPLSVIEAGDASSHYLAMFMFPFAGSTDQLGYAFTNGAVKFSSDLQGLPGCIFCIARSDKSVHVYGPLYLPTAAGNAASPGGVGAVPVSGGAGVPLKYSDQQTGTLILGGTFGTCPAGPPLSNVASNLQSWFCMGPLGHIQASWAGDALQDLVRVNFIPSGGIQCCIANNQIDTTTTTGLGLLFESVNTVSQYAIPEGGATNQGLVNSPLLDAVDGILTTTEPIDLGSQNSGGDLANCAATGTTINKLAKVGSSAGLSCAVITATTDASGAIGVVAGRAGTTGSAYIATAGIVQLAMDGATTVNDVVQISSTTTGSGHDSGSTSCPGSGQVIARVLSTNGGAGTYSVRLGTDCPQGSGGGGVGDPGGNGIMVRTGLNTTVNRSLATLDATHVAVTNADGTAGNPSVDLGSNAMKKEAANTMAAAGTIDASGQTGSNTFKTPVKAACTTTANGALCYDSTNDNMHTANAGADAILPVATTATPGNGNGVKWTKVGSTVKIGDSGTPVVTETSTNTVTNKTLTDGSNAISLLNHQGALAAVVGNTPTATAVYTYTIPGNTLGINQCFTAKVFFKHTTGSASVTYNWTWGGSNVGNSFTSAGVADSMASIEICNAGATGSQTVNAEPMFFGATIPSGPSVGTASKDTTAGQAIALTMLAAATEQVTPKNWDVHLDH